MRKRLSKTIEEQKSRCSGVSASSHCRTLVDRGMCVHPFASLRACRKVRVPSLDLNHRSSLSGLIERQPRTPVEASVTVWKELVFHSSRGLLMSKPHAPRSVKTKSWPVPVEVSSWGKKDIPVIRPIANGIEAGKPSERKVVSVNFITLS